VRRIVELYKICNYLLDCIVCISAWLAASEFDFIHGIGSQSLMEVAQGKCEARRTVKLYKLCNF